MDLQIDRDELVELTRRLIQFKSVNPPGDVREITDHIERLLTGWGLAPVRIARDPMKPNLMATLGPEGGAVFHAYGHTDVVPIQPDEAREWRHDPFAGVVENGRLYGRGAVDSKGTLAGMLLAAKAVAARRDRLRGRIVLWVVADGEVGDREGLRYLAELGHLREGMVVACEPSQLKILRTFKGRLWIAVEVRGRTAHALAPGETINAIDRMADVLAALRRLDLKPPGTSGVGEEILGEAALTFTTIQGGSALNVSAGQCRATLDIRLMPGDGVAACLTRMEAILADLRRREPDLDVTATLLPGSSREPIQLPEETPILRVMREAMARAGLAPAFGRGFSTGGLGNFFDQKVYGVFFGPGSIGEAHRANESVALDDLVAAARVYAHAMLVACGAGS